MRPRGGLEGLVASADALLSGPGSRAAGPGARRARRDGLLALHLGDHRRAQGGRARPPDAPGRSPLWRRRARRGPRRPGLRDLEALLPLCARQCARDPAPRAGQCLSPSGLARSGLGGRGDAELSPHALLLGPDLLRRAAPGRAAAGYLRLRPRMRLRGRAAARRDLRGLAGPLRGRDPRRHGRDRDRVHGALEPAGREPRRVDGGARAGHRGGAARRRRSCGRRRRAGRALGQDAVGGDGLLQAPRPVAADLRRRVAPHRRRVSPRRRRLLRALRPRGRSTSRSPASG